MHIGVAHDLLHRPDVDALRHEQGPGGVSDVVHEGVSYRLTPST